MQLIVDGGYEFKNKVMKMYPFSACKLMFLQGETDVEIAISKAGAEVIMEDISNALTDGFKAQKLHAAQIDTLGVAEFEDIVNYDFTQSIELNGSGRNIHESITINITAYATVME